jgi:hypothetical protein
MEADIFSLLKPALTLHAVFHSHGNSNHKLLKGKENLLFCFCFCFNFLCSIKQQKRKREPLISETGNAHPIRRNSQRPPLDKGVPLLGVHGAHGCVLPPCICRRGGMDAFISSSTLPFTSGQWGNYVDPMGYIYRMVYCIISSAQARSAILVLSLRNLILCVHLIHSVGVGLYFIAG